MTRTDRRGRSLKAFLQAEIAGVDVTIEEMRKACGLTRASYYGEPSGTGRGFGDSFPNSEELRQGGGALQVGRDRVGQPVGRIRLAPTRTRHASHALHRRTARPVAGAADRFRHAS